MARYVCEGGAEEEVGGFVADADEGFTLTVNPRLAEAYNAASKNV